EIVKKSTVRAFVYYLVFTTLYSIAVGVLGFWLLSRQWVPTIEVARKHLPPFSITMAQGMLSTTLPEPFTFSEPDFAFIVDTSGRELDASPYESAILITKTKGIVKKSRFETREYHWAAAPDFQITSDDLLSWLLLHKGTILWTLFSTVALAILPLAWLFLIPPILFLALILMIPAKVFGTRLKYGQTVSIAFYAVTLPTLVQTVLIANGIASWGYFWGIYLIWAIVAVAMCKGMEADAQTPTGTFSPIPPPPPSLVS
ncbi:MAG TPA: DUF1189 family protein, partial [bacterium]|nr:DUF1189 family protein [bacterium]